MTKKDAIKEFTSLKGVGEAKAELLYENGYHTLDQLKQTSEEDLTKIKGISKKNAQDILNQLKEEKVPKSKKPQVKEAKKQEKEEPETPETKKQPAEKKDDVEIVDETEKKYKPKIKPELTDEIKRKLVIRKQLKKRTPEFLREEWFRYKRIPRNWRVPDGYTSKMRRNIKYRPSKVHVGFKGPKEVRGFHPSGFQEVIIHTVAELDRINPKTHAARIGSTVGTKKRLEIAKKAEELNIRLLNMKV
jgi:large subunit ribosomal protein L32e